MESQFLESFVAVIEHGSIAEAARHLNLTAAAIGLRIRALEGEFGTPLLHRAGRTVVATEAGYRVFSRANTVLREINDLRELATSPSMTGQLRLGATFSAITGLLPLSWLDSHTPTLKPKYSSSPRFLVLCIAVCVMVNLMPLS